MNDEKAQNGRLALALRQIGEYQEQVRRSNDRGSEKGSPESLGGAIEIAHRRAIQTGQTPRPVEAVDNVAQARGQAGK